MLQGVGMKVELEINDIVETVSALNNAIIAYNHVYQAVFFGCEAPSQFENFLKKYSYDEKIKILKNRLCILKDIYNHLLKVESSIQDTKGV